jgi:hypothetical protein
MTKGADMTATATQTHQLAQRVRKRQTQRLVAYWKGMMTREQAATVFEDIPDDELLARFDDLYPGELEELPR